MECNRGEAIRAKQIDEKKFLVEDIFGAKKFTLEAQNLFPGLEGDSQMLVTLDMHVAAEHKICGEADWCDIVGLNPLAGEGTVMEQYGRLGLTTHTDNESVGANASLKLTSEAYSLQKVSAANGMHKSTKTPSNSNPKKNGTQGAESSSPAPAPSHKSKSKTFWTVCDVCKVWYEYLRIYLNHNLLCPNCHEAFMATEAAPPPAITSKPLPASTYVYHHPFHYTPTRNPANGIRGRILLDKIFHMFSTSLSTTTTSISQQNQAPLSLHHRRPTSFAKSLAKINQGKRGYFMEGLKTLLITLGTQLVPSAVIQGAIKPRNSQLPCTSLSQPQHDLEVADSTCSAPGSKAMLNEKGVVFTGHHLPQKASMDLFCL